MFETAILSQGPQTKRVWATCLGFAGQAMLVGGMLVAPLIWPQALPSVLRFASVTAPRETTKPPVQEVVRVAPTTPAISVRITHALTFPTKVPKGVPVINDIESSAPVTSYTSTGPVGPATGPGLPESVIGEVPGGTRPAPPVVATPKTVDPPKPPRVTVLQMAEPIQRVNPVYPEIAKRAGISGKVELMGVLGIDGRIHELKVISGHPFLVKAAADAVMRWVYKPTILNGQAVEVSAPITVNFILTR